MSRSDDDELDDEDDRPRRKRRDDDDHEDSEEDFDEEDEEIESSLGGWRPIGEAVFWGVVFLGLTLVAFSLGEGIGVKRPLADKGQEAEKAITFDETADPPKKPEETAFDAKINSPVEKEPEPENKIDLNAPPKPIESRAPITPAKAQQPVPEEPTTKLPWREMIAKSELKFAAKPKPVPEPVDDGPTHRLDIANLTKTATLVPKTTKLDWEAMLKTVEVEPKTTRLDHEAMTKLVTFTPRPKPKPVVEPIAAQAPPLKETPKEPAVAPASLQLREVAALQEVGKAVVLVAKVVGPNNQPLADQLVEWNLDRQGVGDILAIPNDPRNAKPGERPWPTFARTYTAKAAHKLDASLGGAEIAVGETWIAVASESAGGMHAAAQAPAVAAPTAGRAGAFFHWDRAKAIFPDPVTAPAGGEAIVATRVVANEGAAPLPDYRIRYTVTDGNGVESSDGAVEVDSRTDGRAPATFRQATAKPGVTRGKIELLGRHPLSGRPAPVLAAGDFTIRWTAATVAVAAQFPASWRLGESVAGRVVVQNKGDAAVRGLKVRQEIPSGIRLVSAEGAAVDGQGVTWDLDRLDAGAERTLPITLQGTTDGKRSLRAQALARSIAEPLTAAADVVIEGSPSLSASIRDTNDPAPVGSELEYEIIIRNNGNAAARGIGVEIAPTGLELLSVDGTLGGAVRGGRYDPPAIDELPPGGRVTAKLRAKPTAPGDASLAVRLRHPSLAAGLLDERESTVVYRP